MPLGGQFQVNTYTTDNQQAPAVAALAPGGFVVVWQSYGSAGTDSDLASLQMRRFDAAGAPLGDDFQVNTDTTGFQTYVDVAGDSTGGFVVAWHTRQPAPPFDARASARRFGADGTPLGPEFPIPANQTGEQFSPAVAADRTGGFVVAWASSFSAGTDQGSLSIQAQRFDATACRSAVNSRSTARPRETRWCPACACTPPVSSPSPGPTSSHRFRS